MAARKNSAAARKVDGATIAIIVVLVVVIAALGVGGIFLLKGVNPTSRPIGKVVPQGGPGPVIPGTNGGYNGSNGGSTAPTGAIGTIGTAGAGPVSAASLAAAYAGQHSQHAATGPGVSYGIPGSNPMAYYAFSEAVAPAYDRTYPDSQAPQSLEKQVTNYGPSPLCGTLATQNKGFLDANALMPAQWRTGGACVGQDASASLDSSSQNWSRFAPSRSSFSKYITAAGSARLGLSTRTKMPGGIRSLLRPGVPVPMSATEALFNDSDARQMLVADSIGILPGSNYC